MRHATEHELPPATPMASEVVAVIENEAPGLMDATQKVGTTEVGCVRQWFVSVTSECEATACVEMTMGR
jgi:hypothetical protein